MSPDGMSQNPRRSRIVRLTTFVNSPWAPYVYGPGCGRYAASTSAIWNSWTWRTANCAGLTDESIAREFGVSERTIARRIGRLQEALGAQTRFQLGVQASRQGWL